MSMRGIDLVSMGGIDLVSMEGIDLVSMGGIDLVSMRKSIVQGSHSRIPDPPPQQKSDLRLKSAIRNSFLQNRIVQGSHSPDPRPATPKNEICE